MTILNYRSCASIQNKRSAIKGNVHRVPRSTSNWEQFYKALENNRVQWLTNQYRKYWSAHVTTDTLRKIIKGKRKRVDSKRSSATQSPKDVKTNAYCAI